MAGGNTLRDTVERARTSCGRAGRFLAGMPGLAAGTVHAAFHFMSLWGSVWILDRTRRAGRVPVNRRAGRFADLRQEFRTSVRRGAGTIRARNVFRTSSPLTAVMDAIDFRVAGPEGAPRLLDRLHRFARERDRVVYAVRSRENPRVVCLTVTIRPDGSGTLVSVRTYRWTAADGLGDPIDTVRRLVREIRDAVLAVDPEARVLEAVGI
ncbi:MAG: hypothetical protein KBA30_07575 [Clostridia bacterium]|nr:hypothetical protein [Clostridia bacterium]